MSQKRTLMYTSERKDSETDSGTGSTYMNGLAIPIIDDTVDDTEFIHRYEDLCKLSRERFYF